MSNLPELLSGSITQEYGQLSLAAQAEDNPTDTCGSDCSGGGECVAETCLQKEEQEEIRANAFVPAVEGWNEPPAARL